MKSILFFMALASTAHAGDRKWDDSNNPSHFDINYIKNFYELPLHGEIENKKRGWSDSYWPKVNGSIAHRWQVNGAFYKEDQSPSPYQLATISEKEIDLLSPAEKFDLARNQITFPIANRIRKKYKENEKSWRGACNGWTHASLNIDEPKPIVYINPKTQQRIPFGSSDIKGLLAYYYSFKDENGAKFIGKSCRASSRLLFNFNGACTDVHPAALHIMMTNELGIKHRGFAADRDPSVQVWNHPFVKYESRIDNIKTTDISKNATQGTKSEVYVTTTLTYVNELYTSDEVMDENADHVAPSYEPVLGTEKQKYKTLEYRYVLELNSNDRIIGGEWISDLRPDLIWQQNFEMPTMVKDDDKKYDKKKDDWSLLSEIVKLATE